LFRAFAKTSGILPKYHKPVQTMSDNLS